MYNAGISAGGLLSHKYKAYIGLQTLLSESDTYIMGH
jgi:hypothetical protein